MYYWFQSCSIIITRLILSICRNSIKRNLLLYFSSISCSCYFIRRYLFFCIFQSKSTQQAIKFLNSNCISDLYAFFIRFYVFFYFNFFFHLQKQKIIWFRFNQLMLQRFGKRKIFAICDRHLTRMCNISSLNKNKE